MTTDPGTKRELTREQILGLVTWSESIGLHAYLGHTCLYYGKPYPTIDGYYYLLSKRGTELRIGTRPLNAFERDAYQVVKGDHAWIAEAWLDITKLPTTGIGIVTQDEIEGKTAKDPEKYSAPVVHGHPQRMAEKRAEWQLLRKLVPLDQVKS